MSILNKVTAKLPGRGDDGKYFLALLITYRGVETALWTISEKYLEVLGTAQASFKGAGNILETAAEAIDAACEPHGIDVKDVILGLPDSWISQNQILPQYFDKLNELARNLDLSPFAFVALNHAVSNRLKILYGTLLSGYLLNVDQENMTLSAIVSGQLKETRYIKSNHGEFDVSVQKLFAHFANNPGNNNNIYLYGTPIPADAEAVFQRLAIFGGTPPMVKRLDDNFAIRAISLAGAVDRGNLESIHVEERQEQMQEAIAQAARSMPMAAAIPGAVPAVPQSPQPLTGAVSDNLTAPNSEELPMPPAPPAEVVATQHPAAAPEPSAPQAPIVGGALPEGFAMANQGPISEQELEHYAEAGVPIMPHHQAAEPAAVLENQPSHQSDMPATVPQHAVPETAAHIGGPSAFPAVQNTPQFGPQPQPTLAEETDKEEEESGHHLAIPLSLGALTSTLASLPANFPKPHLGMLASLSKLLTGKGFLLLIPAAIIIAAIIGYLSIVKATVTIAFTPTTVSINKNIIVSSKATTVDPTSGTLPGTVQSVDVSGQTKGTATGKKQVGNSAKGQVVIYNKTAGAKQLPAGTKFSDGKNVFTLDSALTVPAVSVTDSTDTDGTPITITKPGKATGNATAAQIGTDSNIASGTTLTVSGQSGLSAAASSAFSGGTSQDVTVVSDNDIKQAQQAITSQLKDQAKQELLKKVGNDQKVADGSITVAITKTDTSAKSGDQAQSFTLSVTAHAEGLLYSVADFNTLVQQVVKNQQPDNYTIMQDQSMPDPTFMSSDKNGAITLAWQYQPRLIPQTDTAAIANQIKGKSVTNAKLTMQQNLKQVANVDIALSPSIANVVNYLPFSASHISVRAVAAQ